MRRTIGLLAGILCVVGLPGMARAQDNFTFTKKGKVVVNMETKKVAGAWAGKANAKLAVPPHARKNYSCKRVEHWVKPRVGDGRAGGHAIVRSSCSTGKSSFTVNVTPATKKQAYDLCMARPNLAKTKKHIIKVDGRVDVYACYLNMDPKFSKRSNHRANTWETDCKKKENLATRGVPMKVPVEVVCQVPRKAKTVKEAPEYNTGNPTKAKVPTGTGKAKVP